MIVVQLKGGLGNQMFQYAMARELSIKYCEDIFFDTRILEKSIRGVTARNFELNNLNVKSADSDKKLTIISKFLSKKIFRIIPFFPFFGFWRVAYEGFSYNMWSYAPNLLSKNWYLVGYWQSENYFKSIRATILDDFSPRFKLSKLEDILLDTILNSNSVSLHVRRGDYISNKSAAQHHGCCSVSYYNDAIEYIDNVIDKPHYFVFSDEIDWARKSISFRNDVTYVESDEFTPSWRDLHLMSKCKHNIIANSSYSWWGAWLNENTDKIVITPNKWFNSISDNLIPKNWLRM